MTNNLSHAQQIAWDLARTLMVSVTLFRGPAGYSVLPSAEYDGAAEWIITDYDPWDSQD